MRVRFVAKSHYSSAREPTLFAPDLLIHSLNTFWHPLQWVELGIGVWLLSGIFVSVAAIILLILISISLILFGFSMIHYLGFYLGIAAFLMINGGGAFSLQPIKKTHLNLFSLLMLQFLTGLNFIYSAIYVKWLTPLVDILLLKKTQAFTFWIPHEKFVLIMLMAEIALGVLFILGRKLRIISCVALSLFIFLSFDLSENILYHSFIYGIFAVFIFLGGYPLSLKKLDDSESIYKKCK